MSSLLDRFYARSSYFQNLFNIDPAEAVRQARQIDLDVPDRVNMMSLRATILVDFGDLTQQQDAVQEGIALLRELLGQSQQVDIAYNLANGLIALTACAHSDASWLDHKDIRGSSRHVFLFYFLRALSGQTHRTSPA